MNPKTIEKVLSYLSQYRALLLSDFRPAQSTADIEALITACEEELNSVHVASTETK